MIGVGLAASTRALTIGARRSLVKDRFWGSAGDQCGTRNLTRACQAPIAKVHRQGHRAPDRHESGIAGLSPACGPTGKPWAPAVG